MVFWTQEIIGETEHFLLSNCFLKGGRALQSRACMPGPGTVSRKGPYSEDGTIPCAVKKLSRWCKCGALSQHSVGWFQFFPERPSLPSPVSPVPSAGLAVRIGAPALLS